MDTEEQNTCDKLVMLQQLNLELLETLELSLFWIQDYSKSNNVVIPRINRIESLLKRIQMLLNEISNPLQYDIRRFFTDPKTDEKFTEPKIVTLI